jgi:hypothetical protein
MVGPGPHAGRAETLTSPTRPRPPTACSPPCRARSWSTAPSPRSPGSSSRSTARPRRATRRSAPTPSPTCSAAASRSPARSRPSSRRHLQTLRDNQTVVGLIGGRRRRLGDRRLHRLHLPGDQDLHRRRRRRREADHPDLQLHRPVQRQRRGRHDSQPDHLSDPRQPGRLRRAGPDHTLRNPPLGSRRRPSPGAMGAAGDPVARSSLAEVHPTEDLAKGGDYQRRNCTPRH